MKGFRRDWRFSSYHQTNNMLKLSLLLRRVDEGLYNFLFVSTLDVQQIFFWLISGVEGPSLKRFVQVSAFIFSISDVPKIFFLMLKWASEVMGEPRPCPFFFNINFIWGNKVYFRDKKGRRNFMKSQQLFRKNFADWRSWGVISFCFFFDDRLGYHLSLLRAKIIFFVLF